MHQFLFAWCFSFNNTIKYIKSIDETLRPAFENVNMLHTMAHLTDIIISYNQLFSMEQLSKYI